MDGGWYRFAHAVMRRPLPIAVVTATVLIALGVPFLGVRFTGVDARSCRRARARTCRMRCDAHFRRRGPPSTWSRSPRRRSRASGGWRASRPSRRRGRSAAAWDGRRHAARPADERPGEAARPAIRTLPGASVAGVTAWYLDTSKSLRRHLLPAGGILVLVDLLLLYLVTRSVVLPVKAIVMNALSLSAAFGVLVWVFQDGRLEGPCTTAARARSS